MQRMAQLSPAHLSRDAVHEVFAVQVAVRLLDLIDVGLHPVERLQRGEAFTQLVSGERFDPCFLLPQRRAAGDNQAGQGFRLNLGRQDAVRANDEYKSQRRLVRSIR